MRGLFRGGLKHVSLSLALFPAPAACLPAFLRDIIFDSYGIVSPSLSYFCNPRLICPTCVMFLKSEVISIHMTCVSLSIVPKGLLKLGGFEAYRVHKAFMGVHIEKDISHMKDKLLFTEKTAAGCRSVCRPTTSLSRTQAARPAGAIRLSLINSEFPSRRSPPEQRRPARGGTEREE